MKPYVITIARQYGSGGKTVGKMLADKLGIPFYNREIITMASEDSGVNAMLFSDERLKGDFLTRLRAHYHGNTPVPNDSSKSYLKDEALFAYQVKIIRRLADQVHISVGHTCSDYETAYRAFLAEVCEKEHVDFVLPLTDVEVDVLQKWRMESMDATKESEVTAEFAPLHAVLCMSGVETIRLCRDKEKMQNFLSERGLCRTIPGRELAEVVEAEAGSGYENLSVRQPY